jgi:sugar diacid utilization regulator
MKAHLPAHADFYPEVPFSATIPVSIAQHDTSPDQTKSSQLHQVLSQLVNTMTLAVSLPEMLQLLAALIVQALELDLCVLLLQDQTDDMLRVCASYPDVMDATSPAHDVHIDAALWEHLRTFTLQGQLPLLTVEEKIILNPLSINRNPLTLAIPLCVGTEPLGLLNCYASQQYAWSEDEQLLLNTIANQTALAIKHRQYLEADVVTQKKLVKAFVADLFAGKAETETVLKRRAYSLGFEMLKPHLVALIELSAVTEVAEATNRMTPVEPDQLIHYDTALTRIKQHMHALYPGILIDERENGLACLLPYEGVPELEDIHAQFEPLIRLIQQECHLYMSVGVGNCCQNLNDYPQGYREASEAVQIGSCFKAELRCTPFAELGAYRYLYPFAQTQNFSDLYQEGIATVLKHDLRKKTNLLDTLEVYLEYGGNIARTASILEIHRNTLLQRISRIHKLCPLDLEQAEQRLSLLLALKVYRLRACQTRNDTCVGE